LVFVVFPGAIASFILSYSFFDICGRAIKSTVSPRKLSWRQSPLSHLSCEWGLQILR
jgi:hypothetical protein